MACIQNKFEWKSLKEFKYDLPLVLSQIGSTPGGGDVSSLPGDIW